MVEGYIKNGRQKIYFLARQREFQFFIFPFSLLTSLKLFFKVIIFKINGQIFYTGG